MSVFGKRHDGVHGRRSAPRVPTMLSASVLTLDRSQSALLVDVSSQGARLRGCNGINVGSDLWIKVGVVDALATVVWIDADVCGVAFDEAMSAADLVHLRAEARNLLFTRLDPKERLAAQHWIHGFAR